LIDSNIDWGQDLVGLQRWIKKNAPDETIGLAYFGQINPDLFRLRLGNEFSWFLPPPHPQTVPPEKLPRHLRGRLSGYQFQPGLYAVSATLVRGLPWRVYDEDLRRWEPYDYGANAFAYFSKLEPFAKIGYSIFLYRVTPEQAKELSQIWAPTSAP